MWFETRPVGVVVIGLWTSKKMLPTGINLSTLKPYHATQEVKEHIFEGSLINEYQGGVNNAPTFNVGFDVFSVEVYLCTIEVLGVAVMFKNVLFVWGIANLCCLIVGQYRYALALVLDGIALFDVYGQILALLVEASARGVCQFWSVLVSVGDSFAVQYGCNVLIMGVCLDKWAYAKWCVKCEVEARHVVELQP